MRSLLAIALLLAAPWAQGQDMAPTLGDALTDGDAATAEDIPAPPAQADEREATLLELEYRLEKMQLSRAKMQVALDNMGADPEFDRRLLGITCKAAVSTLRAPEFFKLVRGKVKFLEKPKNHRLLTMGQVERLEAVKTTIAEMEAAPDIDCSLQPKGLSSESTGFENHTGSFSPM